MVRIQLLAWLLVVVGSIDAGNFYNVNGTSYYISYPTLRKNWYQAQRFCILQGMHLATIHDERQYNVIVQILEEHQITANGIHFWTSGTDLGVTRREYYWAASGFSVTFTHWHTGCPRTDVTTKLCILINGDSAIRYQFYDHDCDDFHYVVCQSDLQLSKLLGQQYC